MGPTKRSLRISSLSVWVEWTDTTVLEVNLNNNYAIILYEKYNFEKVGIRKAYYNNIDDALIMTKKLIWWLDY